MSNIQRNTEDTEELLLSPWQGGHLDQFSTVQPHSSAWLNALLKENTPQNMMEFCWHVNTVRSQQHVRMWTYQEGVGAILML